MKAMLGLSSASVISLNRLLFISQELDNLCESGLLGAFEGRMTVRARDAGIRPPVQQEPNRPGIAHLGRVIQRRAPVQEEVQMEGTGVVIKLNSIQRCAFVQQHPQNRHDVCLSFQCIMEHVAF